MLDIQREHPGASVPFFRKALVDQGRLDTGKVSEPTVQRLYTAHGLPRRVARPECESKMRLRRHAERPGALWHGDAYHVTGCTVGSEAMPIRITSCATTFPATSSRSRRTLPRRRSTCLA